MFDGLTAAEKFALVHICALAREFGWWSGGELCVLVSESGGTRARYAIPPRTLAWVERFKLEVRRDWEAFEREMERELGGDGEHDPELFRSERARNGRRRDFGLPPLPASIPARCGAGCRAGRAQVS